MSPSLSAIAVPTEIPSDLRRGTSRRPLCLAGAKVPRRASTLRAVTIHSNKRSRIALLERLLQVVNPAAADPPFREEVFVCFSHSMSR